jgi:carboxylesterase
VAILPGAEPFSADGGRVGVVVSHGFTGTPQSMRPWAEHLAAAGLTVRLPLLPGHGTRWQDLNETTWPDWYGEIERAYEEVASRCDIVFAAGLSMGGTLVTRLAEQKGDKLAGLVLVNPAYATKRIDAKAAPLISWAVKSRPAIASDIKKPGVTELAYDRTPVPAFVSLTKMWKVVDADLGRITAPILLFRSPDDHVVDDSSIQVLNAGATGTTITRVDLPESYHVATLDNDAHTIFTRSVEFIRSLAGNTVG